MLLELSVTDLGIIEELSLVFGPGMTAFTGETGAGKTLVVEAMDLLVGGRADPGLVRAGTSEATIEGRFVVDDEEIVLGRVIPRDGRSRAYVNGRMATATALADHGSRLVDLHGQHAHQSLLAMAAQRGALDTFAGVDREPYDAAVALRAEIEASIAALVGDDRERAREVDLLRFQIEEIAAAGLDRPDEDLRLREEELLLGDAVAHQEAAATARDALVEESGAADQLARALAAITDRPPFEALEERLRTVVAEVDELGSDLRVLSEQIEDNPQRLVAVGERRRVLADLCRKYGDDIAAVMDFAAERRARLDDLTSSDARLEALKIQREEVDEAMRAAAAKLGKARRRAAPKLALATERHLEELAMAEAKIVIDVGVDPGDEVVFLMAANPGSEPAPLAKVASGGELARTMLALRLVLTAAPPSLVFDEVDAGIGGSAALAVGRSLARLGGDHQVFVVTHLPQVAAWADAQIAVSKRTDGSGTVSQAQILNEDERVVELSRMLSGETDSDAGLRHPRELLEQSARRRAEAQGRA